MYRSRGIIYNALQDCEDGQLCASCPHQFKKYKTCKLVVVDNMVETLFMLKLSQNLLVRLEYYNE